MEKEDLKKLIVKELEKTRQLVEMYRESSQPVAPDTAIGRISRMDAINNKSVTELALRQAESKLRSLEFVLSNVDHPGFGKCIRCGREIPLGRILVRPESTLCVGCSK